jgi:hypothetical protein
VACFVAENAQTPFRRAPFDFEHLRSFELGQAWVSEVKGYGHSRYSVGSEPVIGEPEVRAKLDASCRELSAYLLDSLFETRSLDREAKIAHANL